MGPKLQSQISGDLTHLFSIPLELSCELELINIESPSLPFVAFFAEILLFSLPVENPFYYLKTSRHTHDYHLLSIYLKSSQKNIIVLGWRDQAMT